jgi:hypothetical protein
MKRFVVWLPNIILRDSSLALPFLSSITSSVAINKTKLWMRCRRFFSGLSFLSLCLVIAEKQRPRWSDHIRSCLGLVFHKFHGAGWVVHATSRPRRSSDADKRAQRDPFRSLSPRREERSCRPPSREPFLCWVSSKASVR